METRRAFVAGLIMATSAYGLCAGAAVTQSPTPKPPPDHRGAADRAEESMVEPSATKKILEDNEKDIKKKIEKLYELATELKAEVDKTDSSKVLSMNLLRKAEEIEKLAHDIKNRSKG